MRMVWNGTQFEKGQLISREGVWSGEGACVVF